MKIRTGFVSNSSSTSFCIYGIYTDKPKMTETEEDDYEDAYPDVDYYDGLGLEVYDYDGSIYVGKSWKNIGDNQTGLEFKKEVEEKIKKEFGDKTNCSTIEEAWYNG